MCILRLCSHWEELLWKILAANRQWSTGKSAATNLHQIQNICLWIFLQTNQHKNKTKTPHSTHFPWCSHGNVSLVPQFYLYSWSTAMTSNPIGCDIITKGRLHREDLESGDVLPWEHLIPNRTPNPISLSQTHTGQIQTHGPKCARSQW